MTHNVTPGGVGVAVIDRRKNRIGLRVPKGWRTSYKIPIIRRKICILGEPAVGKTSLVFRLAAHRFDGNYITTVGARLSIKTLLLQPPEYMSDVWLKLMIWEIRGRHWLTPIDPYLRGADAAVVVGDAQRLETQIDLWKWIDRARFVAGDIPIMMVVNKCDLADEDFDPDLVAELSVKYGCPFRMTSARTGSNVDAVFRELAVRMMRFPGSHGFWGGGHQGENDGSICS
jgi:small GTP-binding protein